jgi:hypothetical protein
MKLFAKSFKVSKHSFLFSGGFLNSSGFSKSAGSFAALS